MTKTLEVEGNVIFFQFNKPNTEQGNISENFDYKKKPFVCTIGTYKLIQTEFLKNLVSPLFYEITCENFKNKLLAEIIDIVFQKAKSERLDYLQKLKINNTDCWIIDNGEDICLLLPSEY